jgi:hypothetical protein
MQMRTTHTRHHELVHGLVIAPPLFVLVQLHSDPHRVLPGNAAISDGRFLCLGCGPALARGHHTDQKAVIATDWHLQYRQEADKPALLRQSW